METVASSYLPETLIVNVEEIDDQHAALFARVAELKELFVDTGELPEAKADDLLDTLRQHCATEECLARNAGLEFARHAGKHQQMLFAIDKAMHELSLGKRDVFGLLRYIEYWFERHIVEEDRLLGNNLQQVSCSLLDPTLPFTRAAIQARSAHSAACYR